MDDSLFFDWADVEIEAVSHAERRAEMGAARRQSKDFIRKNVQQLLLHYGQKDVVAVLRACDDVAFALRDKLPEPVFNGAAPYFSSQREEAELWAQFASDGQIAAMLGACFDRIGGTRLAVDDRKRLLVAIWNSLTADDRKAFRDRVMNRESSR